MGLRIQQKKQLGPQGVANVRVLGKTVNINFETGDVYEVTKEAWGDHPAGEYIVTLSKDGNKVVGVKPTAGTYIVHLKEFSNRVNGVPEPKIQRGGERTNQKGGKYFVPDKQVFHALLEVEDEGHRFDGLNILAILPYGFEQLPGTNVAMINVEGSRDMERIELFLRYTGLDFNTEIPFSINVLPWLEQQLLNANTSFMVTTNKDGFIDSYAPLPTALANIKKKPAKKKK